MFQSKEEILSDFIENYVYDEYKTELVKELDASEIIIKFNPEEFKAFNGTVMKNAFGSYIIIVGEDSYKKINNKLSKAVENHYRFKKMIHLNYYKPDDEYIFIFDGKNSRRGYTTYAIVQTKDNNMIIYYWSLDFYKYKNKVKNL